MPIRKICCSKIEFSSLGSYKRGTVMSQGKTKAPCSILLELSAMNFIPITTSKFIGNNSMKVKKRQVDERKMNEAEK